MSLNEAFKRLGFREQEVSVYLSLAEDHKATAHALSKRLSLPRTTVYWLLEGLAKRGMVSAEKRKNSTFYSARQPQALIRMIEREKEASAQTLELKQQSAEELLKVLEPYFSKRPFSEPKLQVFQGKEGVEAMLHDYLPEWQRSIAQADNTWWGYQDPSFAKEYLAWLKLTWKVKKPNERYRVLTNSLGIEQTLKKVAPERGMKFVPEDSRFLSTIWVVGEYIVLIVTAKTPHYAFQIKDELLATNLRIVFQMLWGKL
jgi:sugar-specific transcriptional regulator TrmB